METKLRKKYIYLLFVISCDFFVDSSVAKKTL
jgi:hypothetical protein